MTIPIVQGRAIPSGGDSPHHSNTTPYAAGTTPYVVAPAVDGSYKPAEIRPAPEGQPKEYKDAIWGVLFWLHLIAMIAIISLNIASQEKEGGNGSNTGVVVLVGVTAVTSIGIGSAALSFMMRYAKELVKTALVFSVIMSGIVGIFGFLSGQTLMGILGLVFFAIGICYARVVWPRIPFAAANLNTALTAVRANLGLAVVAYAMLALAFGWSIFWFVGLGDAVNASNTAILFLLLLSYYWVHQVLTNTVHVTTAGTIGTWWFVPAEANAYWSTAINDSFSRATTYSFGSICLGSLIVAIVQSLRAIAHLSRDNDDLQLLTCIIDCILACIQDIIEYLNKWAYVYVGLYGLPYIEAGRNVIQLFQNKGWTVIISDDLCDRVLFLVSLGVGCLTGLIGLALAAANPNLLESLELEGGTGTAGFM